VPSILSRTTNPSDIIAFVDRIIGGLPLLVIGLSHVLWEGAAMQPLVEAMGLPLAGVLAPAAVALEIAAGVSLLLGYWTRAGALLAIVTMAAAFYSHLAIDVWPNPQEPPLLLPLVILASAVFLLWRGGGRWSLDARA
jgi:putative oxidoreductase